MHGLVIASLVLVVQVMHVWGICVKGALGHAEARKTILRPHRLRALYMRRGYNRQMQAAAWTCILDLLPETSRAVWGGSVGCQLTLQAILALCLQHSGASVTLGFY